MGNGKEIVTIGDELSHISLYTEIQNHRFDFGIRLEIAVEDESLLNAAIPKISLQPIVENAFLHGIMEKPDKTGHIRIRIETDCGNIRILIADDGVGMTEEQIRRATRPLAPDQRHGYGLSNIHNRFQLFYGASYGLSFHSGHGGGTTVTVRLPRQPIREQGGNE
ncbi:sensor histidine kinase [Paenibacillus humicola]|uniref:sensor histidine kinase n=1 Tax=Paenibacillus humicola TaxID=3110540 RepID=UPI00237A412D|nr:ATP-binding protein [Paenibacillus humicola]